MKIKKMVSLVLSIIIALNVFLANTNLTASATGTQYYVDQMYGNDTWDGLTTNTPYKTLAKISGKTFTAGDVINLKRGCTWNENLVLHGSGATGNPITIRPYGDGLPYGNSTTKPIIKGTGIEVFGKAIIGGMNLSNWTITDIEVEINNNTPAVSATNCAVGIEFGYTIANWYEGIIIDHCKIYGYGVNTNTYGIRILSVAPGSFNNFLKNSSIQYNEVYNVGWGGIVTSTWDSVGQKNMHATSAYSNIQYYQNTVHNTGNQGMLIIGCTTGIMQYNTVYDCGTYTGTGMQWGAVGIWCMMSTDIQIIYNNVSGQSDSNYGYDAGGIDIDWSCDNIRVRYNQIHHNKGPGIETMANINCSITDNNIYDNSCLTTVGNGQISLSDYTDDTDYIFGVQNLYICRNSIAVSRSNTVAISTKRFTPGPNSLWTNIQVYDNDIHFFDQYYSNNGVYSLDYDIGSHPFDVCWSNRIHGTFDYFGEKRDGSGLHQVGWTAWSKYWWTMWTGYDANTTLD